MQTPAIVTDLASIVQTALAPVFLLAGTAGFVGVYEMRLGRVSDRLNAIQEKVSEGAGDARSWTICAAVRLPWK